MRYSLYLLPASRLVYTISYHLLADEVLLFPRKVRIELATLQLRIRGNPIQLA